MKFSLKKLNKNKIKELNKLTKLFSNDMWLWIRIQNFSNEEFDDFLEEYYKEEIKSSLFTPTKGKWITPEKFFKNKNIFCYKYKKNLSIGENFQRMQKQEEKFRLIEKINNEDMILLSAMKGSLTDKILNNKSFKKEIKALAKLHNIKVPYIAKRSISSYLKKNSDIDIYDDFTTKQGY